MTNSHTANILGEIRAESDRKMLVQAFLETTDYRTLIESTEKIVVIGRRGTGKSALAYRLKGHFAGLSKAHVLDLATTEDQIIGIKENLISFGDTYSSVRTAAKLAWQSLVISEILRSVLGHFKFGKIRRAEEIKKFLANHKTYDKEVGRHLRKLLTHAATLGDTPGHRVSQMADGLQLGLLKEMLADVLYELSIPFYVTIDRLDEGYEPDYLNIALIAGVVQGTIELRSAYQLLHPTLFIRDNIFRSIQQRDPDYSRNIEGASLRLHWDEFQLLQLVSRRLKASFHNDPRMKSESNVEKENDQKIWNAFTSKGLAGKDGFRKCLRLTLYRPRDLLALLNEAFYIASRERRDTIVDDDIEAAARDISTTRLDDLQKEYKVIFPGLELFINAFSRSAAELTIDEASKLLNPILAQDSYPPPVQQQIALFPQSEDVIRNLYSVGFFGIQDEASGTFKFCHDGRTPNLTLTPQTKVLIHPCYWIALNITEIAISKEEAQEIHDDYEIEVQSDSPELRTKRIGQLISKLQDIPVGQEGATEFHDWCLTALRVIFAGSLRNIEKNPNSGAVQRRDIVAMNPGSSDFWRRVLHDYDSRQVTFEIKNYAELTPDDYRQLSSYLSDTYGRIGFIICRSSDKELRADKDLAWIREVYVSQHKLIVMISYKWLTDFLSKVRNPQKHNAVDKAMDKMLDTYHRNYLNERR